MENYSRKKYSQLSAPMKRAYETEIAAHFSRYYSRPVTWEEMKDIYAEMKAVRHALDHSDQRVYKLLKRCLDAVICSPERVDRVIWSEDYAASAVSGRLGDGCPHGNSLCLNCWVSTWEIFADRGRNAYDAVSDKYGSDQGVISLATVAVEFKSLRKSVTYTAGAAAELKARVCKAGGEVLIWIVETPVKRLTTSRAKWWAHLHMIVWTPAPFTPTAIDRRVVTIKTLQEGDKFEKILCYLGKSNFVTPSRLSLQSLLTLDASVNPVEILWILGALRGELGKDLADVKTAAEKFFAEWLEMTIGDLGANYVRPSAMMGARRRAAVTVSKLAAMDKNLFFKNFNPRAQMGGRYIPDLADLEALINLRVEDLGVGEPLDLSTLGEMPMSIVDMDMGDDFWRWQAELEEISV